MLCPGTGNKLHVARTVHFAVISVDGLVLLAAPSPNATLVPLETDLLNVHIIHSNRGIQPIRHGLNTRWNRRHLIRDRLHHLSRGLLRVVVYFYECGRIRAPAKDVATIATLPIAFIETQQGRIDSDIQSLFVHTICVAGTEVRG